MMVGALHPEFCVIFLCLSLGCTTHPQQKQGVKKKQTEAYLVLDYILNSPWHEEIFRGGRFKRKTVDCSLLETKGTIGFQRIIDANKAVTTFGFFIQPLPGFKSLVFRAKLNKLFSSSWKYYKKNLVVKSSQMKIDWNHPTWIPVDIKYSKTDVNLGPDGHILSVKIGKDVDEFITRWWIFYSYEGFTVEVEGPLKVLLNCNPWSSVAESAVDRGGLRRTILIACILSGCFLLVVGAATLYLLFFGRSNAPRKHQNDPPVVSTSLVKGRIKTHERRGNIYESVDGSTLSKLKQNFDINRLTFNRNAHEKDCIGVSTAENTENRNIILNRTMRKPCDSAIPKNSNRDTLAISLLEEKEALRECLGLDSPIENHYVEMHGIVSRTSSLNK